MKPLSSIRTINLAAAALTLLVTSCATPPPQPTAYDELKAQEGWEREHPLSPAVQTALDQTTRDLRDLFTSAFPEYNGIDVRTKRLQGEASGIFVSHPMFSAYSLAVGPAGRAVNQWFAERGEQLRSAHVRWVMLGSTSIYMDKSQ